MDPVDLAIGALGTILLLFVLLIYFDTKWGLPTSYVNWAIVIYVTAIAAAILIPALKG